MQSAIDVGAGAVVAAPFAPPGRQYRCRRCNARVRLRRGLINAPHFAHVAGKADQECEDYSGLSEPIAFRVASSRPITAATGGVTDSMEIYFDLGISAPMLSLWLPACGGEHWSGYVQVQTVGVTRRFNWQHLLSARQCEFPLGEGQWKVTAQGEVSQDYVAGLDLGQQSLVSWNLFEATRSPGRHLGPTARIALGTAVWIVTSDDTFGASAPSELVSMRLMAEVESWRVLLVELPSDCDDDLISRLEFWLKRPIVRACAKVWIENPLPYRLSSQGWMIFSENTASVALRADRPVNWEVVKSGSCAAVLLADDVSGVDVKDVSPGEWSVRVDGLEFLSFEIASIPATRPTAVGVQCNGQEVADIFALQDVIDDVRRRAESAEIQLSWSTPQIGQLLHLDGVHEVNDEGGLAVTLNIGPGSRIDFKNLGVMTWQRGDQISERAPASDVRLHDIRERARWLLSVASANKRALERVRRVPERLLVDTLFARLAGATWEVEFAPQVRALGKAIEELL